MIDWTKSMARTYEHYIVDPATWRDVRPVNGIKKCTISRDSDVATLGSATIDISDSVGECYIRTYMTVNQNGETAKVPLGTHLVQTPMSSFNGKIRNVSMDAYTPLMELKENAPPIGYYIAKGENITANAYKLIREYARAPVVEAISESALFNDFVAETDDTWLSYLSDLLSNGKYAFDLDELGRILFTPKQDIESLQPVWTYSDDNSSILLPELDMDHDMYNIPNVVEVIYSTGREHFYSKVVNDDPNSPTSTVNRGRQIVHRVTDPDLIGDPTGSQIDQYAHQLLRDLSSLEYVITYTHGYCPVRLGDCVRINYSRAGLTNIKAKVISQTIECTPECLVTEKAIFTNKLWG